MTDRERLIELIKVLDETPEKTCPYPVGEPDCENCEYNVSKSLCDTCGRKADYLLKNGVIVPPCNVGDTVYFVNRFSANDPRINECEVDSLHITSGKNRIGHKKPSYALVRDKIMHSLSSRIYFENFGITAFLDREEAEEALAERILKDGHEKST